jgi:hypothetical protein
LRKNKKLRKDLRKIRPIQINTSIDESNVKKYPWCSNLSHFNLKKQKHLGSRNEENGFLAGILNTRKFIFRMSKMDPLRLKPPISKKQNGKSL